MAARNQTDPELIDSTVDAMTGAAPLAFMTRQQGFAAAGRLGRALMSEPPKLVRRAGELSAELTKIAVGTSEVAPDKGDRRFADEAFQRNGVYKRVAQSYLAWNRSVTGLIDELPFDEKSRLRSRFLAGIVTEALAPTNTLPGNPAAIKEALRTGGRSLVDGLRHLAHDVRHNRGLPSMVDSRPFVIGETVATTPGSVVFRNDVLEVLQYAPTTKKVYQRPLLVVPPQVNKYYVLDLAPGRSLFEYALSKGQQVFAVSWRNPSADERDWNLDTYAGAIDEALDAVLEITGQTDLNLLGLCAGGITTAALLGHLSANGDHRVNAVTFPVTILDWDVPSTVGTFTSGPSVAASIKRTQRKGILPGRELARVFAWMRPNDLIWNYWVNNYLMGMNPAAFDVLAWNVDDTNLPAGLHADFLRIASENLMAKKGELTVLGDKVDLSSVTCDAYIVGGLTDHITPWDGCYRSVKLLGGKCEYVACASGHIQTLVCPPDNPKARYLTNPETPETAEEWKAGATEHAGSWWDHWLDWLSPRAGRQVGAKAELGSAKHPALDAAPGRYVHG